MNHINSLMALQEIRAALEVEQRRISEEIRGYPPPIPRCDAQFNALIEQRAHVAQALYDLDALACSGDTSGDRLASFVESAGAIEGDAGRQIRALFAPAM